MGKVPDWLKRYWPSFLIVAGVALLIYVASQYATMYAAQRRLTEQWQQQNLQLPAQPAGLVTTLTRLSIPAIKLDAVVVEGVNRRDLLMGPGHLPDTPQPGQPGNAVISAHRDTFFRHIHELKPGDYILVQRSGKQFRYEVTGKKVLQPDDVWVTKPTPDTELTLLTCYPTYYIGPAPERLAVFSRLAGARRSEQSAAQAKPVAEEAQ
ncbi:MAG TPA: class D sortase [Terriglobales bacterium]|jgi:sortase A|nr:class D sortase [Terriglobales bacterium]